MKKKIFAIVGICLLLVPMMVCAAENAETVALRACLGSVNATCNVASNVTLEENLVVPTGKTVVLEEDAVLDLGGKTLTIGGALLVYDMDQLDTETVDSAVIIDNTAELNPYIAITEDGLTVESYYIAYTGILEEGDSVFIGLEDYTDEDENSKLFIVTTTDGQDWKLQAVTLEFYEDATIDENIRVISLSDDDGVYIPADVTVTNEKGDFSKCDYIYIEGTFVNKGTNIYNNMILDKDGVINNTGIINFVEGTDGYFYGIVNNTGKMVYTQTDSDTSFYFVFQEIVGNKMEFIDVEKMDYSALRFFTGDTDGGPAYNGFLLYQEIPLGQRITFDSKNRIYNASLLFYDEAYVDFEILFDESQNGKLFIIEILDNSEGFCYPSDVNSECFSKGVTVYSNSLDDEYTTDEDPEQKIYSKYSWLQIMDDDVNTGYAKVRLSGFEDDEEIIVNLGLINTENDDDFLVAFESNGGSYVMPQSINAEGGLITKPTAPTREGYSFAGWYTDSELKTAFNFDDEVTEETVLYAAWTENPKTFDGIMTYIVLGIVSIIALSYVIIRSKKNA